MAPVNIKADDRPYGRVVERREDRRSLEPRELGSRGNGTPPGRHLIHVCQKTRRSGTSDDPLAEGGAVGFSFPGFVLCSGESPVHAPTSTTGASLPKKPFQIAPAFRYEGVKLDVRIGGVGTAHGVVRDTWMCTIFHPSGRRTSTSVSFRWATWSSIP